MGMRRHCCHVFGYELSVHTCGYKYKPSATLKMHVVVISWNLFDYHLMATEIRKYPLFLFPIITKVTEDRYWLDLVLQGKMEVNH